MDFRGPCPEIFGITNNSNDGLEYYIFPLTPEGEELMELFFKEIISCRYGTYTFTNTCDIDGEIYNIVIENND